MTFEVWLSERLNLLPTAGKVDLANAAWQAKEVLERERSKGLVEALTEIDTWNNKYPNFAVKYSPCGRIARAAIAKAKGGSE